MLLESSSRNPAAQSMAAAFAGLADSIETDKFGYCLLRSFEDLSGISLAAVYSHDIGRNEIKLVVGAERDPVGILSINSRAYTDQYGVNDPVRQVVLQGKALSHPVATYVRCDELTDHGHRQLLEQADVLDRFACFFPTEGGKMLSLHAMRRATHGRINRQEFRELAELSVAWRALVQRYAGRAFNWDAPDHILEGLRRIGPTLSARELKVCDLTLSGRSAKQISMELGIATGSIQTYRKRAYLKLGVNDMREIFARLLRLPKPHHS